MTNASTDENCMHGHLQISIISRNSVGAGNFRPGPRWAWILDAHRDDRLQPDSRPGTSGPWTASLERPRTPPPPPRHDGPGKSAGGLPQRRRVERLATGEGGPQTGRCCMRTPPHRTCAAALLRPWPSRPVFSQGRRRSHPTTVSQRQSSQRHPAWAAQGLPGPVRRPLVGLGGR